MSDDNDEENDLYLLADILDVSTFVSVFKITKYWNKDLKLKINSNLISATNQTQLLHLPNPSFDLRIFFLCPNNTTQA